MSLVRTAAAEASVCLLKLPTVDLPSFLPLSEGFDRMDASARSTYVVTAAVYFWHADFPTVGEKSEKIHVDLLGVGFEPTHSQSTRT